MSFGQCSCITRIIDSKSILIYDWSRYRSSRLCISKIMCLSFKFVESRDSGDSLSTLATSLNFSTIFRIMIVTYEWFDEQWYKTLNFYLWINYKNSSKSSRWISMQQALNIKTKEITKRFLSSSSSFIPKFALSRLQDTLYLLNLRNKRQRSKAGDWRRMAPVT